jgi:hypothetical protein
MIVVKLNLIVIANGLFIPLIAISCGNGNQGDESPYRIRYIAIQSALNYLVIFLPIRIYFKDIR